MDQTKHCAKNGVFFRKTKSAMVKDKTIEFNENRQTKKWTVSVQNDPPQHKQILITDNRNTKPQRRNKNDEEQVNNV